MDRRPGQRTTVRIGALHVIMFLALLGGLVAIGVALDSRPRSDLPAAWREIRADMPREQVVAAAGQPTGRTFNGAFDTWLAPGRGNFSWRLRVDYDPARRVRRAVAEQYDKYSGRSYYFKVLAGS